jgi:RHS repeat-associated protein
MGQMVAEYGSPAPQGSGGISYLTADSLGTPRVITDSTGAVKARHDYLPLGEEIPANDQDPNVPRKSGQEYLGSDDNVRQKFTQKERDDESGLDYFGARYYGSNQGRFTSPDPLLSFGRLTEPASWNRYSYTLNNPLKFIDPSGLYEYEPTQRMIRRRDSRPSSRWRREP